MSRQVVSLCLCSGLLLFASDNQKLHGTEATPALLPLEAPILVPDPPVSVTATKDTLRGGIRVDWTSAGWAESYDLWRASADDTNSAIVVANDITGTNSFTDLEVGFGTPYYYWVSAKNSRGASAFSASDWGSQRFKLWEFAADDRIQFAPVLASNGTVYVASNPPQSPDSPNPPAVSKLYALTAGGEKKWEFALAGTMTATPAVAEDGTIYCGTTGKTIQALNPDGIEKWTFRTPAPIDLGPALAGDGTIYLCSARTLYAVNADGTEFWHFTAPDAITSSPIVGPDDTIHFATARNFLYTVNANGTREGVLNGGADAVELAMDQDGTIYTCARDGYLRAYSSNGTRKWSQSGPLGTINALVIDKDNVVYNAVGSRLVSLDLTGKAQWRLELDGSSVANPVMGGDGLVYAITAAGNLFAVNRQGKIQWQSATGLAPLPMPPVLGADGTLYVATEAGKVYALQASDRGPADVVWPMYRRNSRHTASLGPPPSPPLLPLGLTASQGTYIGRVRISWSTDLSAKLYQIWRNTTADFASATLVGSNILASSSYDDQTATYGQQYFYWVQARNPLGTSAISSPLLGGVATQRVAWVFDVPAVISSPLAVAEDETIYFCTEDSKLHAVTADGKPRWIYPLPGRAGVAPAIGPDRTLYESPDFPSAFSPEGIRKWTSSEGMPSSLAPAIGPDGTIYYAAGGTMLAFSPDGTNRWRFDTDGVLSSPSIGNHGTIYFHDSGESLFALGSDGALQWRALLDFTLNGAPIVGGDGTIYVGSPNGALWAVAADGGVRWRFATRIPIEGALAVGQGGTIYCGGRNTNSAKPLLPPAYPLYAIKPDGTRRWEFTTGSLMAGIACASDGTVCFGDAGNLVTLNGDGTRRWTFVAGTNAVGIPMIGQNGRMYVSAGNKLYALEAGVALAASSWPCFRANPQLTAAAADPNLVKLLRPRVQSNSTFEFEIPARAAAADIVVEISSDLIQWKSAPPLQFHTSWGGIWFGNPLDQAAQQRFYRVVLSK